MSRQLSYRLSVFRLQSFLSIVSIKQISPSMLYFITSLIAVLGVCWIHPRLVAIALDKNIVDNPDARKLQRKPVPVLGGIAVFSER